MKPKSHRDRSCRGVRQRRLVQVPRLNSPTDQTSPADQSHPTQVRSCAAAADGSGAPMDVGLHAIRRLMFMPLHPRLHHVADTDDPHQLALLDPLSLSSRKPAWHVQLLSAALRTTLTGEDVRVSAPVGCAPCIVDNLFKASRSTSAVKLTRQAARSAGCKPQSKNGMTFPSWLKLRLTHIRSRKAPMRGRSQTRPGRPTFR